MHPIFFSKKNDMKTILKTFSILSLILSMIACESNPDRTSYMASTAVNMNSSVVEKNEFKFDAENLDIMEPVGMKTVSEEDVMNNIHKSLMAAKNEAELLDVKFSMSDEPVENGLFIFSIESPDSKKLIIEMYDEEGYELTANNEFRVEEGNNYKALNVKNMENGAYVFRLKDEKGREINRTVDVVNK
jgi:hypothetical protein